MLGWAPDSDTPALGVGGGSQLHRSDSGCDHTPSLINRDGGIVLSGYTVTSEVGEGPVRLHLGPGGWGAPQYHSSDSDCCYESFLVSRDGEDMFLVTGWDPGSTPRKVTHRGSLGGLTYYLANMATLQNGSHLSRHTRPPKILA